MGDESDGAVVKAFPPLPRRPTPPQVGADPRQRRTSHIVGNLQGMLAGAATGGFATANLTTGFHAAAVDVGKLQSALETGLVRFRMATVISRWPEVQLWISETLFTSVQRLKQCKVEQREAGIRVQLVTQDDLGYYDYGFDVFPGRDPLNPR